MRQINDLPLVLQNYIYEYNVDHRVKMKRVLYDIEFRECRYCSNEVCVRDIFDGGNFMRINGYGYFCDYNCFEAEEYSMYFEGSTKKRRVVMQNNSDYYVA